MRVLVLCFVAACATTAEKPDAVGTVLDAFRDHSVVALDEGGHGNLAVHGFVERVLRDPRSHGLIDDIVVEFGTAKYQGVIDTFVNGGHVPDAELRNVWRETTQVLVWDAPVYERFFRLVREINSKLPAQRRIRVLLADPPIDWSSVNTFREWGRINRDKHAADVVEREVLSCGRKALMLFGAMHLARKNIQVNYAPGGGMLVEELEQRHPGAVYSIYVTTESLGTPPVVTPLAGTALGKKDFAAVLGDAPQMRFDPRAGKPLDPGAFRTMELAQLFDAALDAGPAAYSEPPPITDDAYYRELVRRSHVLNDMALSEIERLHVQQ